MKTLPSHIFNPPDWRSKGTPDALPADACHAAPQTSPDTVGRSLQLRASGQAMVEYVLVVAGVILGSYFLMWVLADLLVRGYDEIAAHVCLPIP